MASILALAYTSVLFVVEAYWYNKEYRDMEGVVKHKAVLDLNFF